MAEIPRVPQATPPATVNQPVHRIAGAQDRPHSRKEHERPQEDVLELHEEEATPEEAPLKIVSADDEGHLDIAV